MLGTRENLFGVRENRESSLAGGLDKPSYILGIHMLGRASLS